MLFDKFISTCFARSNCMWQVLCSYFKGKSDRIPKRPVCLVCNIWKQTSGNKPLGTKGLPSFFVTIHLLHINNDKYLVVGACGYWAGIIAPVVIIYSACFTARTKGTGEGALRHFWKFIKDLKCISISYFNRQKKKKSKKGSMFKTCAHIRRFYIRHFIRWF